MFIDQSPRGIQVKEKDIQNLMQDQVAREFYEEFLLTKRTKNPIRLCTCGSGIHWSDCNCKKNTPYCG